MEEKIVKVLNEMSEYLTIAQTKKLQEVIISTFAENEATKTDISNEEFLVMFLAAKKLRDARKEQLIIIGLRLSICFQKLLRM